MAPKINRREFLIATGATAGLTAVGTSPLRAKTGRVRVVGLKADYLDRPLGLENQRPRLSWRLESDARNVRQSAYRILVARSEAALKAGRGDLWDSGKIESRKSFGIPYQGRELTSRERCWWSVQVWDEGDMDSAPSAMSWWEMGLLDPKDWTAQWLAVEDSVAKADREAGLHWIWGEPTREKTTRAFRFKFHVPTASNTGCLFAVVNDWPMWTQITRIWIDGAPVAGSGVWGDFDIKGTTESDNVRVTLQPMSAGEHLIAVEVSTAVLPPEIPDGFFAQGFALFVRLDLENGETWRLGSGPNWKTSLVQDDDWYRAGYDDRAWEAARPAYMTHQPWPPQPAWHLRREFSLDQPVVKARLYATALGAYEARLNGRRVGDALLTPEVSQYAKRVLYRVYDVTAMLQPGANALGLTVGDGWYASDDDRYAWAAPPRRVLAQLELTLADGSRRVVSTGPGWHAAESAIRESQIRIGEIYDARLEQPGWDLSQFDASHWQEAEVGELPACRLVAHTSPPIRAAQILKPSTISQPKPGIHVFDFGQNFAGWCRLHVRGSRGTRIELKFAELLTAAGEVDQPYSNIGIPKKDIYILRGDARGETFEPHFTYRGFRYVEVSGLPAEPTADSLEGVIVHSDLDVTGRLRIGAPLIEEIWRAIVRTRWSNFVGMPTDCPSREQRYYTVCAGICWDDATFNMDICAYTRRLMDNIVDDQAADGAFPIQAPEPRNNNAEDHLPGTPPGSGDAGIIIPWTAWRRYGDLALIERHWEAMNRHVQFILDSNPDYIWKNKRSQDLYGDHLALDIIEVDTGLPRTSKYVIATAYWAHSADLLAEMAEALGRMNDAERLRTIADRVRRAFNETFVQPDGTIGEGSQASYVLALKFGLLPDRVKQIAAERLAADIRNRGVSLTTGVMGTQFILDVLADAGFVDLAYGLLLRTDYPSWGYMVRQGATTIWETWSSVVESKTSNGGIGKVKMARNHSDLGSISGFLFRRIAGIDAGTPGFETIVVRPVLDHRVKKGGGDYDSIMGRISTDWSVSGDHQFSLDVSIPANASARIHLPTSSSARIQEGRQDIARRKEVRLIERSNQEAVLEVGSGRYRFVVSR